MNSMKIGTYQMDTTFGLYLPEYTIPAPAVQTNFVKIIGRDGSVDLSNALGLHYDSRTWSLDFKCFDPTVNWHTLSSQVMNAIHGKRLNFEFDDDPNYFWTGRVSVQNYVSNHGTGTLKVTIVSDPFKYAKLSTIVTKTASTGTEYTGALVTFNTANAKINDLSVTMQPIQDLHGYDSPWPAGGGVNKFDADESLGDNGFVLQPDGSWYLENLESMTPSTVMWECPSSYTGQVTLQYYYKNVNSSGSQGGRFKWKYTDGTTATIYADNSTSFIVKTNTSTSGKQVESLLWDFGTAVNSTWFKDFEVVLDSTAPAFYSPYSNISTIGGWTGLSVYVSPTQDPDDATTYSVDWTTQAGTVYGGTLDVVTGVLTVDWAIVDLGTLAWGYRSSGSSVAPYFYANYGEKIAYPGALYTYPIDAVCSQYKVVVRSGATFVDYTLCGDGGSSVDQIQVKDPRYTDAATFKTAMSGVQLCYELATPLTYQLTAQEIEALVGTNNVWSDGGNVTVAVVTPETLTNNGRAVVPTLTASADMVLKWGNYSASVQQGTSTIPQLILENGANLVYIIGTGSISFTWQEANL